MPYAAGGSDVPTQVVSILYILMMYSASCLVDAGVLTVFRGSEFGTSSRRDTSTLPEGVVLDNIKFVT